MAEGEAEAVQMAKESKRGSREAKKPKKSVPKTIAAAPSTKGDGVSKLVAGSKK